jgi:hypothetical protein
VHGQGLHGCFAATLFDCASPLCTINSSWPRWFCCFHYY